MGVWKRIIPKDDGWVILRWVRPLRRKKRGVPCAGSRLAVRWSVRRVVQFRLLDQEARRSSDLRSLRRGGSLTDTAPVPTMTTPPMTPQAAHAIFEALEARVSSSRPWRGTGPDSQPDDVGGVADVAEPPD